jgi:predicted ester cyclase
MTREEILALVERRRAAWKARDIAAALAATHADRGIAISPTGGVLEGRAEIERVYRLWLSAFNNLRLTDEAVLIDGDRVAQIATLSGTHTGEFFGLAPTGRQVDVQVALLMTVADGFVVEERRI